MGHKVLLVEIFAEPEQLRQLRQLKEPAKMILILLTKCYWIKIVFYISYFHQLFLFFEIKQTLFLFFLMLNAFKYDQTFTYLLFAKSLNPLDNIVIVLYGFVENFVVE